MKGRNYLSNIGFLYGYEPSGHSVVAKAISEFLPKDVVDFCFLNLSDIFSNTAKLVLKGYLEVIQKTPALWSYLYDNPLISFLHKNLGLTAPKIYSNKLERHLAKKSVDFIVSTHAFSSIIGDKRNMKIRIKKHIGVVTDLYAHSFWPSDLDRYFVPHYETYKSLVLNGVDQSKIEIVGMPLRKEFYIPYNIKQARKRIGIQDRFTFLISGGSKGLGDIFSVIDVIRSIKKKVNILVMCGSNRTLLRKLRQMKYVDNVRILPLGYTESTAIYYAVSDCVIGKPGGVTIFEVAGMGKPFIVWNTLPGQEERNRDFLRKHSYAICPKNERELRSALEGVVDNLDLCVKYSKNISSLHRRDSSIEIVRYIMESI